MSKAKFALEILRRIPSARISRANIAVTFRCNHKCLMCNIWKQNKRRKGRGELTSAEISQIIRNNGLIWVSLTGGEPFLNVDMKWILSVSMLHSELVSVVSNGSQPEWISECVNKAVVAGHGGLLVLSLSLEGDKQQHDRITGVEGSYEQVISTIEKLKRINSPKLYLGVEYLLSPLTDGGQSHVKQVADYYKIGLTYTREQKTPYYWNADEPKPVIVSPPEYKVSLRPFDMIHNLFAYGLRHDNRKLCEAGRYSVFVDPYANVYPCLPQAPQNPIKNLRDTNYVIGDISEEAEELYRKCPSPCYTPCEVYASMLFRPWRLL